MGHYVCSSALESAKFMHIYMLSEEQRDFFRLGPVEQHIRDYITDKSVRGAEVPLGTRESAYDDEFRNRLNQHIRHVQDTGFAKVYFIDTEYLKISKEGFFQMVVMKTRLTPAGYCAGIATYMLRPEIQNLLREDLTLPQIEMIRHLDFRALMAYYRDKKKTTGILIHPSLFKTQEYSEMAIKGYVESYGLESIGASGTVFRVKFTDLAHQAAMSLLPLNEQLKLL